MLFQKYIIFVFLFWGNCSPLFAQLSIQPQRTTAYYTIGETAFYEVQSPPNSTISYRIFHDQRSAAIETGIIQSTANGSAEIPFVAKEAGIYLCEVQTNSNTDIAALTFDVLQLGPLEAAPADFDAFWDEAKAELANIPLDAQQTFYDTYEDRTIYRVNVQTVDDRRVYGYLTVPNAAGNYPAMLTVPPFGQAPNIVTPETVTSVQANCIALSISIHNAEPDAVDPSAYQPNWLEDPNSIYYKNAVIACIRAIDFIFSLDKFDGENLVVNGVSQGGGLAILAAGIDERVKVLGFSNAALCQHQGIRYNKASGFPYYIDTAEAPNIDEAAVAQAIKYMDAVYAARRFKGAVFATISLEDLVCPASTVFAAYNEFRCPKMVVQSLRLGHDTPNDYWTDRVYYYRNFIPTMESPATPWFAGKGYYATLAGSTSAAANIPINISATVGFDDTPNDSWAVRWQKIEGPGSVRFEAPTDRQTSVSFSESGTYTLKLSAFVDDYLESEQKRFIIEDYLTIVVD